MSKLGRVIEAVEKYNRHVLDEVKRARTDKKFGKQLVDRWDEIKRSIKVGKAPTGLELPRLALPEIDEPGEIARYLLGDGLPGEFPFLNGAYKEMYLEPLHEPAIEIGSYAKNGHGKNGHGKNGKTAVAKLQETEEPTRLFSGMGLPDDTNKRFHYLGAHQRSKRLSTAFDGPTLYGIDSDADGVFGKIGEGGVAVDTVEDMERLYAGFDMGAPSFSASMTISGPAPIIMAMYIAAAKRRFGSGVVPKLRGTIQADIFKEVQAQNETIFPVEASLRFLGDMMERLSHRRSRLDAGAAGGLHALERIRLRGNDGEPRHVRGRIRPAAFVLSRLRTGRRIHRAHARVAAHLGDRNAGCVWRRIARPDVQGPHPDERTFTHRRRVPKQPDENGG
jgi:methylmalonyl-CoA mutase